MFCHFVQNATMSMPHLLQIVESYNTLRHK